MTHHLIAIFNFLKLVILIICEYASHILAFAFIKYDVLTEYLTLFWLDLLKNKYKPEFRKMRNLECFHLWVPIAMSKTSVLWFKQFHYIMHQQNIVRCLALANIVAGLYNFEWQ